MNKYKIDWNGYGHDFPYALYARKRWGVRWQIVGSFKTVDAARDHFLKLDGLPIYMTPLGTQIKC